MDLKALKEVLETAGASLEGAPAAKITGFSTGYRGNGLGRLAPGLNPDPLELAGDGSGPARKAPRKKAAAKKKNPEMGLDYDPVVQGQDYAESYRLDNLVIDGDKATAEGVAEGFPPIKLRLVRTKSGWIIDGAGAINPGPKAKS